MFYVDPLQSYFLLETVRNIGKISSLNVIVSPDIYKRNLEVLSQADTKLLFTENGVSKKFFVERQSVHTKFGDRKSTSYKVT